MSVYANANFSYCLIDLRHADMFTLSIKGAHNLR